MNKLLFGIAAGIAIGLLIAPDKGSETLKNLKRRFQEYADDAANQADDLMDRSRSAYNRATDEFAG
jgi:gas vesicle protein